MKTFLALVAVLASVIVSFAITWLVWEMQLEGRAYYCIDTIPFIPSDGFLTSMETHESDRDRLQPGWTWDELRRLRRVYLWAFVIIAVALSKISLRIVRHISHEYRLQNEA